MDMDIYIQFIVILNHGFLYSFKIVNNYKLFIFYTITLLYTFKNIKFQFQTSKKFLFLH